MKPRFRDHAITLRSLAFALATLPLTSGLSQAIAKPAVEVAFVLDTTGSMGGLIEGAKRKIWSIATAIVDSNPDADIRMGLVAYRDIGDDYVTKKIELTRDIQDLYANLLELKARGVQNERDFDGGFCQSLRQAGGQQGGESECE